MIALISFCVTDAFILEWLPVVVAVNISAFT